jgi:tripartite-type tricarboxylate transporter receptor subunit TctC
MLGMERFRLALKLKVTHIPYKGAGPATLGLLTNEADLLFANPGVFMPHIKAGRLRSIAIADTKRIQILPDVPTMAEGGYPGFESSSWYGLAAPARTPAKIVSFVHAETVKVLAEPDIISRLAADGASPLGTAPHVFAQEIRDDIAKWAKVIKEANIKL